MNKSVHYIGLDVHKETIAVAIAPETSGEVRNYGIIGGIVDAVDKLVSKLSARSTVVDCCFCQLNSPLFNVTKKTVKKRERNLTALLTFTEPYQLSHPGQNNVNRESGTKGGPRACSALVRPYAFHLVFPDQLTITSLVFRVSWLNIRLKPMLFWV